MKSIKVILMVSLVLNNGIRVLFVLDHRNICRSSKNVTAKLMKLTDF
jgi:hypothetical protein